MKFKAGNSLSLMGLLAIGMTTASLDAQAAPDWAKKGDVIEKCYGVSVKGQNDCGSKNGSHACGGMSKKDKDPNEWVYTPKGVCKKLGGKVGTTKKVD